MKKYITLIWVAALFATACERDLNVDLPPHQAKLVVNAFLDPETPFEIYLTRSYGPTEKIEEEELLISDAVVEVIGPDGSLGIMTYRDSSLIFPDFLGNDLVIPLGKYELPQVYPEPGKKYSIKVSHPTWGEVTAETLTPSQPEFSEPILERDVARVIYEDGYAEYQSLIKLDIQDKAGEANYYRLRLEIEYKLDDGTTSVSRVWIDGPAEEDDTNGAYKAEEVWLSDKGQDGELISASFLAFLPNSYRDPSEQPEELEIVQMNLEVFSANEDMYLYAEGLRKQAESSEAADVPIFPQEAVVVYSNIEGGYGVWAGLAKVKKSFP